MKELWLFCEICGDENPHEVLKSRTSNKKGFRFQGIVKCGECSNIFNSEIKEVLPISLPLRISVDNETLNSFIDIDRGILLEVGQTRPHPDGLIQITGLELINKRPLKIYSDDKPIIWAKRVTHTKVRFAIHDGEHTSSFKQEFESQEEFYVGMKLRLEGRLAIVKDINLFGGKSVKAAHAIEITRVTCRHIDEKRRQRNNSSKQFR